MDASAVQAEQQALGQEYEAYIRKLKVEWLAKNRITSGDVYEVMRPHEREKVHQRMAEWGTYVTPFAEAWWKERGFGVIWPEKESEPIQVYKLEQA